MTNYGFWRLWGGGFLSIGGLLHAFSMSSSQRGNVNSQYLLDAYVEVNSSQVEHSNSLWLLKYRRLAAFAVPIFLSNGVFAHFLAVLRFHDLQLTPHVGRSFIDYPLRKIIGEARGCRSVLLDSQLWPISRFCCFTEENYCSNVELLNSVQVSLFKVFGCVHPRIPVDECVMQVDWPGSFCWKVLSNEQICVDQLLLVTFCGSCFNSANLLHHLP